MQSERNLIRSQLGEAVVRRIAALSVTAFLLASCSPEAPGGGDALPPADAPAEPSPPADVQAIAMSASGAEPFWRVDITNQGLTLTRPDAPAETAKGVDVTIAGDGINMASAGPPAAHATFTKGECSDGMSDLKYPYKVELTWGSETLKGCGFETAKQPREGQ